MILNLIVRSSRTGRFYKKEEYIYKKARESVPVTYPTFQAFALPTKQDKQRRSPRRYAI